MGSLEVHGKWMSGMPMIILPQHSCTPRMSEMPMIILLQHSCTPRHRICLLEALPSLPTTGSGPASSKHEKRQGAAEALSSRGPSWPHGLHCTQGQAICAQCSSILPQPSLTSSQQIWASLGLLTLFSPECFFSK